MLPAVLANPQHPVNAIEAALLRDDDYTSVWLWLDHAVTRDNAAGLVFDLEPAFADLLNRSRRAHLTSAQNKELQLLLGVCRRRCESLLPKHAGLQQEVRSGFNAARQLVDLWMAPPVCRSGHTVAEEPYASISRFHGVLRAMRRDQVLPTSPAIDPFADCEIIPFPKPCQEHAR